MFRPKRVICFANEERGEIAEVRGALQNMAKTFLIVLDSYFLHLATWRGRGASEIHSTQKVATPLKGRKVMTEGHHSTQLCKITNSHNAIFSKYPAFAARSRISRSTKPYA